MIQTVQQLLLFLILHRLLTKVYYDTNSLTAATVSNTPSIAHEGINYDINSPTAATVSNTPPTAHEGIL